MPFILAAAAKHDRSGRLIASLNLVIGAGLAAGPLMAGVLLDKGASLATLFAGAALISVLSSACLLRSTRAPHTAKAGAPLREAFAFRV